MVHKLLIIARASLLSRWKLLMAHKILTLAIALLISGCNLWRGEPVAPQLVVKIKAAANINPNVKGKPFPVGLRLYQLSDNHNFNQAPFFQIYNNEQNALKSDLLLSHKLKSIHPKQRHQEIIPLAKGTVYIGVIAAFEDYSHSKNKALYKLVNANSTTLNIELNGINISISSEDKK